MVRLRRRAAPRTCGRRRLFPGALARRSRSRRVDTSRTTVSTRPPAPAGRRRRTRAGDRSREQHDEAGCRSASRSSRSRDRRPGPGTTSHVNMTEDGCRRRKAPCGGGRRPQHPTDSPPRLGGSKTVGSTDLHLVTAAAQRTAASRPPMSHRHGTGGRRTHGRERGDGPARCRPRRRRDAIGHDPRRRCLRSSVA
jgi:hypothetical protein